MLGAPFPWVHHPPPLTIPLDPPPLLCAAESVVRTEYLTALVASITAFPTTHASVLTAAPMLASVVWADVGAKVQTGLATRSVEGYLRQRSKVAAALKAAVANETMEAVPTATAADADAAAVAVYKVWGVWCGRKRAVRGVCG
jgi:hypothetical protein